MLEDRPAAPPVRLAPAATVPPIGGMSQAAMIRTVDYADGWFLLPAPPPRVDARERRSHGGQAEPSQSPQRDRNGDTAPQGLEQRSAADPRAGLGVAPDRLCYRAFDDFVFEFSAANPQRLIAAAQLSPEDPAAARDELERVLTARRAPHQHPCSAGRSACLRDCLGPILRVGGGGAYPRRVPPGRHRPTRTGPEHRIGTLHGRHQHRPAVGWNRSSA
jgi:hypothetical protein